jgi:hypothetical protein
VIVDTAQIQSYIFGSNRLRENIGASHLVASATGAWALEAVRGVVPHSNVTDDLALDDSERIDDAGSALDAEVLYSGGGNVVALFRCSTHAKAFIRQLSRKVLEHAPGLHLVITSQEFEWIGSLAEGVQATFAKLAKEKRARLLSSPLLGLGVTVMCRSTALPAVAVTTMIGGDPTSAYPASAESLAKLAVAQPHAGQRSEADKRLHRLIPPPEGFDYPSDFDNLGRTFGEQSYLAVVHADGDGMGKRIQQIGEQHLNPSQNRDYITALRGFSSAVEQAARAALRTVLTQLTQLMRQIDPQKEQILHHNAVGKELARIKLKSEDGKWLLPFRPIVFGGDDVTFVADGRLGLSLALEYLKQFEQETANRPACRGRITACAGIAMVKAHYPFARAYALAEELSKSAKVYRRKFNLEGSCLDWHFALSGLSGGIEEIRRREYTVADEHLTLRPVTMGPNPFHSSRSWEVVWSGIKGFQGKDWVGRHNKVKALRDALREGPEWVERFLWKFNEGKALPMVEPSMTGWPEQGWHGKYCGYFDAVELADWFVPLSGGPMP